VFASQQLQQSVLLWLAVELLCGVCNDVAAWTCTKRENKAKSKLMLAMSCPTMFLCDWCETARVTTTAPHSSMHAVPKPRQLHLE
jgi:hypothetical protein